MGSSSLVARIGTGTIRIVGETDGRSGLFGVSARTAIATAPGNMASARAGKTRENANERGIRSLIKKGLKGGGLSVSRLGRSTSNLPPENHLSGGLQMEKYLPVT